jgi:excinuclease ABC subunit A
VAVGTAEDIAQNPESITGLYIRGARKIEVPTERRAPNGKFLTIRGAYANNLKDVDVSFPLGLLTVALRASQGQANRRSWKIFFTTPSRAIFTAR